MPHLHVALVTGRPEANLIPLLQLRPERIRLVASERMAEAADRLHQLLREQLGDDSEILVLKGLPDTDPRAISHYAYELADKLIEQQGKQADLEIIYDLTGGTKLMAVLFQEAMRCCDAEMLYADSDAGSIYHMRAELKPDSFVTELIKPVLNTELYLQANGKRLRQALSDDENWQLKAHQRKAVTKHLGRNAHSLVSLIGTLNYLINVDKKDKPAVITRKSRQEGETLNRDGVEQQLKRRPEPEWREALVRLAEADVLEWSDSEPRTLRFNTLDGAQYVRGGWLEEYAWHCARDAGLEDVHCGAQVTDEVGRKQDVRNEFDCLAVYRNRMLIIECKTNKIDDHGPDQQILHKLHSLADQSAGLFGTRVLLTARQFGSDSMHETNLKRAQGMHVEVMEGAALKQLPERINGWMVTGKW